LTITDGFQFVIIIVCGKQVGPHIDYNLIYY